MATATENFTVSELQTMKGEMQSAYDVHIKKGEVVQAERMRLLILKGRPTNHLHRGSLSNILLPACHHTCLKSLEHLKFWWIAFDWM